jgi:phage-related protein
MATASAFFDSVSSNIVSATRSATGTMEAAMVRGVQSNVARLTSGLATAIGEAISTGVDVVGRAIDEASNRANEVLQGVVSRVREWGNTLTQNVLSGLSRVLGSFVNRFGGALNGAPERLRGFIGRFLQGMSNAVRGAPGRVATHLASAPLNALRGGGVGALFNRYDARTGRYHNVLTNRFTTMRAGRDEAGGGSLLGAVWARVREGFANLAQRIRAGFASLMNVARGVWASFIDGFTGVTTVAQSAFHQAVTDIGRRVRAAFTVVWGAARGLASALWSALDTALSGALTAITSVVQAGLRAAMSNPYVLAAAVVALVGGVYAAVNAATTAAFSAVASVGRFAAGAMRSGWALIAPVLSRVWGALVSGWQTVSRVLGNFWGWLTTTVSRLWQSLSSVASSLWSKFTAALPGIISGARAFIGNFFALIGGALKIGIAGAAMGAFAKAVYEAAKSAMELAKNVQALSASSGLSFGAANQVLQRGRSLGISDSATAGIYGGEAGFIQRLKAAVFGLPGAESGGFNSQAAARFQQLRGQGPGGQMMANAMAKLMGLTSPEQQRMLMMNPSKIRAQEKWTENLNARMGNTPDVLRKFAEDVPLAFGKIGAAWEAAKVRLAVIAAPIMERVLEPVINWLGNNAEKISAAIETVARWMFVKAVPMFAEGIATVADILARAVDWIIGFGEAVASGLPKWLGVAVKGIADVMVWLANTIHRLAPIVIGGISGLFETVGNSIAGWLDSLSKFLMDATTNKNNPLRSFADGLAQGLDGIRGVIASFLDGIAAIAKDWLEPAHQAWTWRHDTAVAAITTQKLLGKDDAWVASAIKNWEMQNPDPQAWTANLQNVASNIRANPHQVQNQVDQWFQNNPTLQGTSGFAGRWSKIVQSHTDDTVKWINKNGMMGANWTEKQLRVGANTLAPQGEDNIGVKAGNIAAGYINQGVDFMKGTIKPAADTINAAAQSFKEKVGTEEQRKLTWQELMLKEAREQTASLRQMAIDEKPMPASTDATAAYMLLRYAKESGAAVRRLGQ